MLTKEVEKLHYLFEKIPAQLLEINEDDFSFKPSSEKWSKKEILGHLIDSATNNHQRFIRVQFEDTPAIFYDQNNWNTYGFYQQMPKKQLIDFWVIYNTHLMALIMHIPNEHLYRTCKMKDGSVVTLEYLIQDYVVHLEHHLKQIIHYESKS